MKLRSPSKRHFFTAVFLWGVAFLAYADNLSAAANSPKMGAPLFNNLGDYHHPITTQSPLAQRYFDQGLLLFYGFDSGESIRSFQESIHLDPTCAMCYWGLALALGSKNNMPMNGHEKQEAISALKKAQAFVNPKNLKENAYISALSQRYVSALPAKKNTSYTFCHGASLATKEEAQLYATAMHQVALQFPKDVDAQDLYAFSLFDVNQWHFWQRHGQPYPNTLDIVNTLQSVFTLNPDNIAAHHYYIHVMEQSQHPDKALASANFLREAVPGAEHLLHMPSHIYLLTGRYHEASKANQKAIAAFKQYQVNCLAQGFEPEINYLYQHNIHFLWVSAAIEGRRALALKSAKALVQQTPLPWLKQDNYLQLYLPVPYFAEARFAEWHAILQEKKPPEEYQYVLGIWHYARGVAYLHLNKTHLAENELTQLQQLAKQGPIAKNMDEFGETQLKIAVEELAALLAEKAGKNQKMLTHLEKAVQLQDNMGYKEPPSWYFQTREALAYALLKIGQPAQAEIIFKQSLEQYSQNAWTLFGLEKALRAQNKTNEAAQVEKAFQYAWRYADIPAPIPSIE